MIQLSSKNYDSSLCIKILKMDKFGHFSCDIDYNNRTDAFRDVISLLINQYEPRRLKGTSDGHSVFILYILYTGNRDNYI